MKNLISIFAVIIFNFTAYAQNTDKLLENYLTIKNSLISGDSKAAHSAGTAFYEQIKNEANFTQKAELLKAAEKFNNAGDIEKQRNVLGDVSGALWKVVKNSDKINQPVYYQYCPMKKMYWVSKDKDIKNPYFGSSMLTCGKTTETKN
ncbi:MULTISPECIES: DUF3347 domain-containing protein [Chryseobacterium]|uniref:DUF3347 domain-containing protein n=1 Tax=Chryseobacterium aquaticum subsp. greenlandense TaxID=345663 RepID=A0A101CI53_9FLAO|nr:MULTISPECIES: DUF3347 domain-containing protein [Chryseobacterium]KUJ56364.1 hypothetical protein AR686_07315 [Chryseobacterium aquaticum subsp. greenlandense]